MIPVRNCEGEVHGHVGRRLHEEQRDQLRGQSSSQCSGFGEPREEWEKIKQR